MLYRPCALRNSYSIAFSWKTSECITATCARLKMLSRGIPTREELFPREFFSFSYYTYLELYDEFMQKIMCALYLSLFLADTGAMRSHEWIYKTSRCRFEGTIVFYVKFLSFVLS